MTVHTDDVSDITVHTDDVRDITIIDSSHKGVLSISQQLKYPNKASF